MKKFFSATCVVALVVGMLCGALSVSAQRGQGGFGRARRRTPPLVEPQFPGRNGRLPNPRKARQRQIQNQELMEALGVTGEQRVRIAELKRNHDEEAIPIGRRIRQARNALDRAIMSPDVDEALIKRYTDELAAAQADQVRFQSRRRVQMRSVLTSEQIRRLLQLEQEQRRQLKEEKRDLDKEN